MKRATLKTNELEVVQEEVSRLRAVLETIRDTAAVQAVAALDAKPETSSAGVAYIGRLASDALEAA